MCHSINVQSDVVGVGLFTHSYAVAFSIPNDPFRYPPNGTDDAFLWRVVDHSTPQDIAMPTTTRTSVCPNCAATFPYRSNKRFCSPKCRKNRSQLARRRAQPVNAANSTATKRDQHRDFELAARMAETLYRLHPEERLGYIEEVLQLARSGTCPQLRRILTMPALIRPDPQKKHLFFRGSPAYCTISRAADRYCRSSPWRASVVDVVRGVVSEPPTGEVLESLPEAA